MNKQKIPRIILKAVFSFIFALIFSGIGAETSAAATPKTLPLSPLEISGWIPYWRKATGTAEALSHISTFKEINPGDTQNSQQCQNADSA